MIPASPATFLDLPSSNRRYGAAQAYLAGAGGTLTRTFGPFPRGTLVRDILVNLNFDDVSVEVEARLYLTAVPKQIPTDTAAVDLGNFGTNILSQPYLVLAQSTSPNFDSQQQFVVPIYYSPEGDYPFIAATIFEASSGTGFAGYVAPVLGTAQGVL